MLKHKKLFVLILSFIFVLNFNSVNAKESNKIESTNFTDLKKLIHIKELPISDKVVYLTFDDGPSENTIKILEILDKNNVKATFFVNGNISKFGKDTYQKIHKGGHVIGNHTFSHNYANQYKSVESFMEDYYNLDKLLYEITGEENYLLRFPGGSNNTVSKKYGGAYIMKEIQSHIKEVEPNVVYFDWNVDSGDANGKKLSSQDISNNVINGVLKRKRAIVLMHDSKPKTQTVEALDSIISRLKQEGYSFEVLNVNTKTVQFQ